ncbi:phosphopantetheine-binding protein [Streptomyces sp. NBC_00846]|uniref:phosphopantetheine-binding protein n=1 Tax=Streptomyces sp. NBC_00846 TaxID=2975849 RepID=UPI0038665816|nr:phosphopantetheine-binding protein [Streptomyces sp. NBC_00846]
MNEKSISITEEQAQRSVPATNIEKVIDGIFRDVLAVDDPLDVTHSFFRIGGTSIMGAKVIARISARYQVQLSLRTIFEFPTVRDLAQVVESEIRSNVSGLSDAEVVALTTRKK